MIEFSLIEAALLEAVRTEQLFAFIDGERKLVFSTEPDIYERRLTFEQTRDQVIQHIVDEVFVENVLFSDLVLN